MFRRRRIPPALILYTSENCGLCVRARQSLADLGLSYDEVEVPDEHAYRLRTPVLEAGGRILAEGDIGTDVLRRALGRRRLGRGR